MKTRCYRKHRSMGSIRSDYPAKLVIAIFSRHVDQLDRLQEQAAVRFGKISHSSPRFDFDDTRYYEAAMGQGLQKMFLMIEGWFDVSQMASIKVETNRWEEEAAKSGSFPEARPLNIDPGYLTATKLVLASTKERAHRIFLQQGIFAEVTMKYVGGWQFYPWTYSDYQRPESTHFFSNCRDYLLECQRQR